MHLHEMSIKTRVKNKCFDVSSYEKLYIVLPRIDALKENNELTLKWVLYDCLIGRVADFDLHFYLSYISNDKFDVSHILVKPYTTTT